MGKIIVSENVSLDGVVQDPTGEEGFERGGWFFAAGDEDREAWAKLMLDEALRAAALLLGRRSDEWFAARWPSRHGAWADRLNSLPKYVVSSTVREARWSNASVVAGEIGHEVSKLKRDVDGDIVVYASNRLVRTLVHHDLVDEFRLVVYPIVVGSGERLFGETGGKKPMRLGDAQAVGDSLTLLTYRPVRDACAMREPPGPATAGAVPKTGGGAFPG